MNRCCPIWKKPATHDPRFTFRPFYALEVEGRYQLLNDNLSDLTHLAYLHRTSIGVDENASTPEEREETEHVLRSRRLLKNVPLFALARDRFGYEGPVDRLTGMDLHLPGFRRPRRNLDPAGSPGRAVARPCASAACITP